MEKNKLMMIVIIAILAIMLAAVGFGFMYTISMIKTVQKPQDGESTKVSQEFDVRETTIIPLANSLKANLLPESDKVEHLALVSVSIGVAGPADATKKEKKQQDKEIAELVTSMMEREVIITDTIITQLRKTTYSELRRADGQDILQDAIVSELQNVFNTNYIVKIYFGDFFLQ